MKQSTNLLPVMFSLLLLAAADGVDADDGGGGGDDVAEGLEEFMSHANGGICILLHMSLPNGRLHAEEMMMMIIIEHGAQANCCTTRKHTPHPSCPSHAVRKTKQGEGKKTGGKGGE